MIHLFLPYIIFLTFPFLYSSFVLASDVDVLATNQNKTEWTIGIGLGVFEYNLYPGAKEVNSLLLPAPYFTFKSPHLEIDRGIKSFLYHSDNIVIDISADFGLPVDSDDTRARKGMPDLDFILQFGPSLEFLLTDKNYFDIRFEVPVRVAYVLDFKQAENIGYLIEPRLSFNHQRSAKTGLAHKVILGLKFATENFHEYYYDVAAEFVTAARPEFNSHSGYGGSFVKYRISYKTNDFVYWAFLRYQSLRGAVFEDSPLVLKKDYYFIGFGFAWIFANTNSI